ncbi:MAG: hypothetical protein WA364_22615, partial [Candidatus Nitrosopolaris sp.]
YKLEFLLYILISHYSILLWKVMSLDLTKIENNSRKNQRQENELLNLMDKAYYVDAIKYKIDNTSDLEYND